ncbi:MAG TPA: hypothetical protein PKM25_12275 [Candidatus Ozemobacteraceae bacterium]|nr:hypothetical protein [Candidatus Ozemobacteraceae bacterium]
MSSYYDRVDLSDIRWFFAGCILLLLPILYVILTAEKTVDDQVFSTQAIESRTSAFDLLPTKAGSSAGTGAGPTTGGVMAHIESKQSSVETELDKA